MAEDIYKAKSLVVFFSDTISVFEVSKYSINKSQKKKKSAQKTDLKRINEYWKSVGNYIYTASKDLQK